MTKRNWIAITSAIVGTLWASQARATMLEELDTTQLTREAHAVQIGEVTASRSVWDADKRMIYTLVQFKVDQTLKGEPQKEVVIRQAGGRANGIGMVVHGMASFRPGERALVFLRQGPDGTPSLVGMAQGKYRIYRSAVTGEEMALFRAPKNLEFYTRGQEGQSLHVVRTPQEKRVLLRDLIGEIQAAARTENP